MGDAKELQKIIDSNIEMTEELIEEYKLNWCLIDAMELINKHGKDWFFKRLEEKVNKEIGLS